MAEEGANDISMLSHSQRTRTPVEQPSKEFGVHFLAQGFGARWSGD